MDEAEKSLTLKSPQPLGMLPEFIIQPNAISQSCYDYSAIARKLIAMAMGLLPPDLSELTARFTFTDFCKALGIERSGDLYDRIKNTISECTSSLIKFETGKVNKKGERTFYSIPWFSLAKVEEGTEIITMIFNHLLVEHLKTLKNMFAKIPLEDFGKLSSKYAIRYLEISLSFAGFEGKRGNKRNEWYFEYTLDDLKTKFLINNDEYKRTDVFKKSVIENPIKELNAADIGIEITPEYSKTGRNVTGAKFNVKNTSTKKKTKKEAAALPDGIKAVNNSIQKREADDEIEQEVKEKYPEEFTQYVNEYLDNNRNDKKLGSWIYERNAVTYAMDKLKAKYKK